MSKKEQKITVTIDDIKRNGQEMTSVMVGKNEIGVIVEDSAKKRFEATVEGTGQSIITKTHDDAVNELLREYHLHQG
ncbi:MULTISPECIES: DUF2969 domain-containing protein [Latilactobacillus]|jgi:hypothetical protein|uniref:DUF2969 domain-containing protein n=2 Tax=Latilactobacillus curvatus TaxID=28038 RepID=A0A0B2XK85_LATCU|nr:DUF2969 domain-containing protein [Latilactobacillus curvatus]MDT3394295.1 DUF2969 domain-containing protein [Bacillota bacterium]ANJ69503.1 hypothetical protein FBA2_05710 [Latilactobacillus curvatus]ANY13704.1 hypothetical protein BCY75_06795 [Latilactobacillus curvatus]AOO75364.1 hypothetical protein LCW_04500 [Latilactobacillus curvatus]ASN59996.1 DUF2969 domain-containing protein [Latilactobacillus curvatus]